jgi:PAS domain S-box-containing protein
MAIGRLIRRLLRRRLQLTLFSGLATVCLLAAIYMTAQVFLKLDEFGATATDNMQWTVAQLEVEQVKAINAFERLDADDPTTQDEARRRFNTFYSRVMTLKKGREYADAFDGTDAAEHLERVHTTLVDMIPAIDGSASALFAARPEIITRLEGLTSPIRQLSRAGLAVDARQSEAERNELSSQLIRLALMLVLMVVGMLSLLMLFWRLGRLYRRRARENRITLNRLSTMLNTSQDAVLVVRPCGEILDMNDTAARMFGLDPKTAQSSANIDQVLLNETAEGKLTPLPGKRLVQSCADGPNRNADLIARGPDGRRFPVELSADMAARSGDEVCVCFIRDISRRVAAESEMQVARDNALAGERAKARFLAMISHEMRTPLHGILGTLDLLDETRLTKEQRRYAQIMHGSGQQLLNQINDALDITHADGGSLRLRESVFNLDTLLRDLVEAQSSKANARNTTLTLSPADQDFGQVLGDRGRVQQVLVNLVANAIKFTENGTITIEATRHGGTESNPDLIEFQITDTGIGIAEQDLPRIFDDYVRLGGAAAPLVEGTGLGLGIARQLVTLMGGQIGVKSDEGQGSRFWVRLPLPKTLAVPASTVANGSPRGSAACSVLIAEDNVSNRYVLTRMIEKDGHRVRATADGAEAIAAADREAFDIILLDISMPGISGIEAARRITQGQGPSQSARLIFLTAHLNLDPDAQLRASGAEGILTKPLPRAELRAILAGKRPSTDLSDSAPLTAPPILDRDILDQLHAMLTPDHMAKTLKDFHSQAEAILANVPSRMGNSETRALAEGLHKLAGSAAILGASAMQAILSHAEDACLSGRITDLQKHLSDLQSVWQATQQSLASYRNAA